MKKVLIVTYYFPPAGGPGIQRVLKFVKYLPAFGWEPVVLTVEKGDYPALDDSLLREVPDSVPVYRSRILEPYDLYRRFTHRRSDERVPVAVLAQHENLSLSERIARFVRANLFIPDGRVGWIPFAVKEGVRAIRREGIDVIFTSSPPQTVQLIGMCLKQKTRLPWVADFRDPWTDIDYYSGLKRWEVSESFDRILERKVLRKADTILSIGPHIIRSLKNKQSSATFKVIYNGYDEDDFRALDRSTTSEKFRITHIGNAGPARNPEILFHTLGNMVRTNPGLSSDLELCFIGNTDRSVIDTAEQYNLESCVKLIPYMPHNEAIACLLRSAVLLLIINRVKGNRGILTGKLFDYIGSGKPVIAIGPIDGDAATVIRETSVGQTIDYSDPKGCESLLQNYYDLWKSGKLGSTRNDATRKYERRYLTQQLAHLFEEVCTDREPALHLSGTSF